MCGCLDGRSPPPKRISASPSLSDAFSEGPGRPLDALADGWASRPDQRAQSGQEGGQTAPGRPQAAPNTHQTPEDGPKTTPKRPSKQKNNDFRFLISSRNKNTIFLSRRNRHFSFVCANKYTLVSFASTKHTCFSLSS